MEDFNEVTVRFQKDTYEKMLFIAGYENRKNTVKTNKNRPTDFDLEDFITGCVRRYILEIEGYYQLAGYDDLGKPFKLKNRFKEYLEVKGWDQKYLCEITGINKGSISTMVANKNQPSLDYFLRVWVAFGCPPLEEILYRESSG